MPPVWNQRTPSLPEDLLPVDVAFLHLCGGAVGPVGAADGAANAKAPLGEVQADAGLAADAVEGHPLDVLQADAALQQEVFQQPADRVVGEWP